MTRTRHRPLSHSAREDYKSCPKKFAYGRELRLEPVEKKKSLRMGTAFGLCVEHRDPERAADGYFEGVPLHEQILDHEAQVEIAQVKLLAELYCERYPDHQTYDVVEHEVEFKSAVLGHGFLDGVFEVHDRVPGHPPELGERVGMEGKLLTRGIWWNDTARKVLAIDDQVNAYFAAMREIGRPLDRLLYRVTFKPGIGVDSRKVNKVTGRKGETIPEYIERLRGRIASDPSYAFEEHELYRSDEQIDRFLEECDEVNEHVKLSRRRGAWPQNTKACTMFGGCTFLPLCRGEVGATDLYRVRPEPTPPPKLPRLGKVQREALLVLADSFTDGLGTPIVDIAKQLGRGAMQTHGTLQTLVKRELATRHDPEQGDTLYDLTDEGRRIAELLR
jgi:hypothetical protein